jgi:predicted O-linked N-acetylglucosamine transferase (SPINDLY family)
VIEVNSAVAAALEQMQRGDFAGAQKSCRAVLAKQPNNFNAHLILGAALYAKGDPKGAVEHLNRAYRLNRRNHDVLTNRGLAQMALGDTTAALADFDAALAITPQFIPALCHRGNALMALGRGDKATEAYEACLKLAPGFIEALLGLGGALLAQRKTDGALAAFHRAASLNPREYRAQAGRAQALFGSGRFGEAIEVAQSAAQLAPLLAEPLIIIGKCYLALSGLDEAKAAFDLALTREPRNPDALHLRGEVRFIQRDYEGACADLRAARDLSPVGDLISGQLLLATRTICDWREDGALLQGLHRTIENRPDVTGPFAIIGLCDQPGLVRRGIEGFVAAQIPPPHAPRPRPRRTPERLRIGYVAGEFRTHPTAFLICETLERHDRKNFEILGFSIGPTDQSAIGARVRGAVDRMIECVSMDVGETSRALAAEQCDVLVDLSGHIAGARLAAFADRPSPVQVSFLGFPGTCGASFMDYVIADRQTVEDSDFEHYTESICRLPHCYQCTSPSLPVAKTPTRASLGLPEDAFVFCSFNNNWKITPDLFDIWMRILRERPSSVLWMFAHSRGVEDNLRREAATRGVAPERLVFAAPAPHPQHLARQRHADLFLDTLPYNAHTTATEALMAGVPLVTRRGKTFAGRVAASILANAGLSDLVAETWESYANIALQLSGDAERHKRLKADLAAKLPNAPLFDNARYTSALENAYRIMHNRAVEGLPPQSFDVDES